VQITRAPQVQVQVQEQLQAQELILNPVKQPLPEHGLLLPLGARQGSQTERRAAHPVSAHAPTTWSPKQLPAR
jgi:hypothetical protein